MPLSSNTSLNVSINRDFAAAGLMAICYVDDGEGGHAVSDALQRPELTALRTTFLIDRLMN